MDPAPASGRTPFGGILLGVGALLACVVACLGACSEVEPGRTGGQAAPMGERHAADPAAGMVTELDGLAPELGEALLAELGGDEAAARAGFEHVLDAPGMQPQLAARAALHLAQMEQRAGRSGHARDLALRASALAPNDPVIYEGSAQLRAATQTDGAGDMRGPPLGTKLAGVAPEIAKAFAEAEQAFARVHRYRPQPIIEALSSSIRAKEDATEAVVRQYLAIADAGGLAAIAGHYRTASLYHDLALGLTFELPPELDPNVAAGLRRTLRDRARGYLKKATAEYKQVLDAPGVADSEQWRVAAEADLRGAQDLLGETAR